MMSAVPLHVEQKQEINNLKQQLKQQQDDCSNLKIQLEMERFLASRFAKDDKIIQFHTRFTSYVVPTTFFKCVEPSAKNMLCKYYEPGPTLNLAGRRRNLLLIDVLFVSLSTKSRSARVWSEYKV